MSEQKYVKYAGGDGYEAWIPLAELWKALKRLTDVNRYLRKQVRNLGGVPMDDPLQDPDGQPAGRVCPNGCDGVNEGCSQCP